MPDTRQHRGPHPQDEELFSAVTWPRLQSAVEDFSWLLTRGYATPSALKLVGDRFHLAERQRLAVLRSSCSDQALAARREKLLVPQNIDGRQVCIDGFNVITTIEAAMAGGLIILGRDGCYRDMASMHGSYRKVAETEAAILQLGRFLQNHFPHSAITWFLDRPVSNSGRLRAVMVDFAGREQWPWSVELVDSPDRMLKASEAVVASADSNVLDGCRAWVNLARMVVSANTPHAWVAPLVKQPDHFEG